MAKHGRQFAPIPDYSGVQAICPPPEAMEWPVKVCLDVEVKDIQSRDVDDTLLFLLAIGDPRVRLCCVTIVPGTQQQVAIVKQTLEQAGVDGVPIGATNWPANRYATQEVCWEGQRLGADAHVSEEWLAANVRPAADVLAEAMLAEPDCVVITGAALTNLADGLRCAAPNAKEGQLLARRWIGQGGYASRSVVESPSSVTSHFDEFCPSFNVNQEWEATEHVLKSIRGYPGAVYNHIGAGLLISSKLHAEQNVMSPEWSHRINLSLDPRQKTKDSAWDEDFGKKTRLESLALFQAIAPKNGKKLHDVLMLAAALMPSVCRWTPQVELAYQMLKTSGRWQYGCRAVGESSASAGSELGEGGLRISYWMDTSVYVDLVLPLPRVAITRSGDALQQQDKPGESGEVGFSDPGAAASIEHPQKKTGRWRR